MLAFVFNDRDCWTSVLPLVQVVCMTVIRDLTKHVPEKCNEIVSLGYSVNVVARFLTGSVFV